MYSDFFTIRIYAANHGMKFYSIISDMPKLKDSISCFIINLKMLSQIEMSKTHSDDGLYYLQGSYRNRKSKFKDFSRTFQGLFTFFQESFFMDSNSPNTAYMQDFCPIQDRKRISLSSSLFLPDLSSVYCLRNTSFLPFPISALLGFTSGCIRFVLLESNRIEYTAPHFIFYYQFCNSLDFYCHCIHKKTVSIIFKDFL